MDNPEYENFLLGIADKVAELVAVPENRKRFEQHSCDLGKKKAAYLKAWKRRAKQMPSDPLSGFQSVLTYDKNNPDEPPRLKIDEALAYYYFSLATIHDKMYDEGYTPIHNDSCAKQLAESVWAIIENLCVDRRFIIETALDHVKTDLAKKPQKPTGDSVGQLIKYIDTVLDDVRQLEDCQSRNPYVDKRIKVELATAYHEVKKYVKKILAERPEIKDEPPDSTDSKEYLRNAHMWCIGLLYWENGERIGAEAEQDTTLAKRQRTKKITGWIFKKTSHLIYFLAALLTCIYLLWWLWTKIQPK